MALLSRSKRTTDTITLRHLEESLIGFPGDDLVHGGFNRVNETLAIGASCPWLSPGAAKEVRRKQPLLSPQGAADGHSYSNRDGGACYECHCPSMVSTRS
jgi:hypothetical protein